MTSRTFHPARLHGSAATPPAKSEAHRALLLAALGRGECRLHGFMPPLCDDTQAMINGIDALGARVTQEGDTLLVQPAPPDKADTTMVEFHVHACAAALRMLIPAFWIRGQAVRITMEDGLYARPLDALLPLAAQAGVSLTERPSAEGKPACVELCGRMRSGDYEVDGSLSSQFASGLLIALAHASDDGGKSAPSTLKVTQPIVSRPYVDMTLRQMDLFGVPYEEESEGRFALRPAREKNPNDIDVSGDWSQGAVFLCANAMGSGILVENLRENNQEKKSLQGDARIVALLRQMGMSVLPSHHGIYVTSPSRAALLPLTADCADIPDLAPILALTCTQARGQSTLTGVKRLRVKECDRLKATVETLTAMGADVSVSADDDTLTVQGPVRLKGGFTADARGDHRMVMMLAAAALIADGPITVTGVESVNKSWPGFLETYQKLGGKLS